MLVVRRVRIHIIIRHAFSPRLKAIRFHCISEFSVNHSVNSATTLKCAIFRPITGKLPKRYCGEKTGNAKIGLITYSPTHFGLK